MTDRTCLDVAADAVHKIPYSAVWPTDVARAALDAIHPALAHLTPDDVTTVFDHYVWYVNEFLPDGERPHRIAEVLSRV